MIIVTKGYDAVKVAEFEETPGLEGNDALLFAAAKFVLGDNGCSSLHSMNMFRDGMRIYPYKIEYTLSGNVKYAGQVKTDGTNPDFYTVRREA